MIKIGITGGIGSGKTTIAKIFENEYHIPVYYCDAEAKRILATNQELRSTLINMYGEDIFDNDVISKKFFHETIFINEKILKEFNSIIHKYVVDDFLSWSTKQNSIYILVEAAILIESGSYRMLDYIINVNAPIKVRIERVKKRSGWSDQQVINVMNNQLSDEDRDSFATFKINNDGNVDIYEAVKNIDYLLNNTIKLEKNKEYIFYSEYFIKDVVPSAPDNIKNISSRLFKILSQESETKYNVEILDSGANFVNNGFQIIDILDYDYIIERYSRNIIWKNNK